MKTLKFLAFFSLVFLLSCNDVKTTSQKESKTLVRNIKTNHLISLLEKIDDQGYITNLLDSLDFNKKSNEIYISTQFADVNEPKHWIHIYNIGEYSSVSFSTADKESWQNMLRELENYGIPESFNDGTSEIAKRYIGQDYTFESYEPKNGINLAMNSLYQIIVFKTKKE